MKGLKNILFCTFLLAILMGSKTGFSQQDPLYTQYMDNLLIINPGYAGSQETGKVLLVARNQWVTFRGAPTTRSFSYNTPISKYNFGLGLSLLSDKIGPLNQTGFYLDYSYFLQVGQNYKLGMGLKGGFNFYRASLTDLQTVDPDPIYSRDIFKNFLPNFGVGAFLFSQSTYFGLSIPKLLENKITRDNYSTEYISREKIHIYAVAGKKFNIVEDVQLKTHSMLKWTQNTPPSLDITSLFGFKDRFWIGAMYRFGDSYGFLAQFNIAGKMLIGYSYDLTISELNAFNNGTHEIMFGYDLNLFRQKNTISE